MGRRRDRMNKRQTNAIATRKVNSLKKAAECGRREKQIISLLKEGELPYTPGIMSWLSDKLGKKAKQITTEDVKTLIKG